MGTTLKVVPIFLLEKNARIKAGSCLLCKRIDLPTMKLQFQKYYPLYNRTNNKEVLFKENENYLYFLRKFRKRFEDLLSVYSYCLMPIYFHFFIKVVCTDSDHLMKQMGIHLSSYTKANLIDDTNYLITLITYIHQNPIRAQLVDKLEYWPFSSYPDLVGYRNGTFPDAELINSEFKSKKDFANFSESTLETVKKEYWV